MESIPADYSFVAETELPGNLQAMLSMLPDIGVFAVRAIMEVSSNGLMRIYLNNDDKAAVELRMAQARADLKTTPADQVQ